MDVYTRAFTSPFRCVRTVHVGVSLWTWVNVPVPAPFGVLVLSTCVYASQRGSTYLYRPFSVRSPCSRSRGVRLWTCIHVPVPELFSVLALCTWLNASGRGCTCLYRPFPVCSPCAREYSPLEVEPRACTGPLRWVRPVLVGVPLWTWIHVPVPAFFGV